MGREKETDKPINEYVGTKNFKKSQSNYKNSSVH